MTNQTEINRAVHLAMGKCWHEYEYRLEPPDGGCATVCVKCDETWGLFDTLPDYCSSLDLVSEFEAFVIEKAGDAKYVQNLTEALFETNMENYSSTMQILIYAIASALQRAEAGLKALNIEVKGYEAT